MSQFTASGIVDNRTITFNLYVAPRLKVRRSIPYVMLNSAQVEFYFCLSSTVILLYADRHKKTELLFCNVTTSEFM